MIEIAACMNDLSQDAVWGQNSGLTVNRLVKITSVWTGADKVDKLGFEVMTDKGEWANATTMDVADFVNEYVYAQYHYMNTAREGAKVQYAIERTLSAISDRLDVETRTEGRELVKRLMKLTKLSAAYDVLSHEWDEGCEGVGCCADTAEEAGDFLKEKNAVTEEELKEFTETV